MYSGLYRGVPCYSDEYDLSRSDVLSLLNPLFLNMLAMLRFDGIHVTKLIVKNRQVHAMSYDEKCDWVALSISDGRHSSVIDRQTAPPNALPLEPCAEASDRKLFESLHKIVREAQQRPSPMNPPVYLNPKDFAGVRLVGDPCVLFTMSEDLIDKGLFGWLWDEPKGKMASELRVATQVPEGYIYMPPEIDPGLQPTVTRPHGMKGKVYPAHMHLLDP